MCDLSITIPLLTTNMTMNAKIGALENKNSVPYHRRQRILSEFIVIHYSPAITKPT